MWAGPNTESAMVCRLYSLPGAGPIGEGAGEFGTHGAAETATLAMRAKVATRACNFIRESGS